MPKEGFQSSEEGKMLGRKIDLSLNVEPEKKKAGHFQTEGSYEQKHRSRNDNSSCMKQTTA